MSSDGPGFLINHHPLHLPGQQDTSFVEGAIPQGKLFYPNSSITLDEFTPIRQIPVPLPRLVFRAVNMIHFWPIYYLKRLGERFLEKRISFFYKVNKVTITAWSDIVVTPRIVATIVWLKSQKKRQYMKEDKSECEKNLSPWWCPWATELTSHEVTLLWNCCNGSHLMFLIVYDR